MRLLGLFLATLALGLVPAAAAQPPKGGVARVTVSGKESGIVSIDDGIRKQRFVLLQVGPKTAVKVQTDQDVAQFNKAMLADHSKLTEDFIKQVKALGEAMDFDGIKKVEQAFRAASDELLKHLNWCTAEGTLEVVDGELLLNGQLRAFAYKGPDKIVAKGQALVEGEPFKTKANLGQGEKWTIAVNNGAYPLVFNAPGLDKLAEKDKLEPKIRAFGALRLHNKKLLVLDVEKMESVK